MAYMSAWAGERASIDAARILAGRRARRKRRCAAPEMAGGRGARQIVDSRLSHHCRGSAMSQYAMRPTTTCHACGRTIDAEAVVCTGCGVMQGGARVLDSEKRILPALLLAFVLGPLGAHRFYVGKTGTAILQLVTIGGLGLWWLYDVVMLITGNFTDAEGEKITEWT
jgi:hypothetical protein